LKNSKQLPLRLRQTYAWPGLHLHRPPGADSHQQAAQTLPREAGAQDSSSGQLSDPARDAKTKAEAAGPVADPGPTRRPSRSSRHCCPTRRIPPPRSPLRRPSAGRGAGDEYIDALVAMLVGSEPSARAPGRKALVTYKQAQVTAQFDQSWPPTVKGDKAVRVAVIAHASKSVLDKNRPWTPWCDSWMTPTRPFATRPMDALTKLHQHPHLRERTLAVVMWWNQNKKQRPQRVAGRPGREPGQDQKPALGYPQRASSPTRLTKSLLGPFTALTPAAQRTPCCLGPAQGATAGSSPGGNCDDPEEDRDRNARGDFAGSPVAGAA